MGKGKAVDPRKWIEKNMIKAIEDVTSKKMGVNEASRMYEIPLRTLRRHIIKGWKSKQNIGRPSELGYENEVRLEPFKSYLSKEVMNWFINSKGKSFSRYHISKMIGDAWYKSAMPTNSLSGFQATGIYPYNPEAIPEHFFNISDASVINNDGDLQSIQNKDLPLPSTSTLVIDQYGPISEVSVLSEEETPTKTLQVVSPLPVIHYKVSERKQHVKILTSDSHIATRKLFAQTLCLKKKTDSESEEDLQLSESNEECSDDNNNTRVECLESYYTTKKKTNWIQCLQCSGWFHEDCSNFAEKCNTCGGLNKGKGKG